MGCRKMCAQGTNPGATPESHFQAGLNGEDVRLMRIRRHFGRVPGSVPKIRPASLVRLVLERKRGRVSSLILDQAAERHIDQCRAQMVPGPVERIECRS